jgi:hypothetical protein
MVSAVRRDAVRRFTAVGGMLPYWLALDCDELSQLIEIY